MTTTRPTKETMAIIEKYGAEILLFHYATILINDLACQAVVELEGDLKKVDGLYRQEVKRAYGMLKDKYRSYTRLFNTKMRPYMETVVTMEESFEDEVKGSYDMLGQSYVNLYLKHNVKEPYFMAKLSLMRDYIYFAGCSFIERKKVLRSHVPRSVHIDSFSYLDITSWEPVCLRLIGAVLKSIRQDDYIEANDSQIQLAQSIVARKICDPNIINRIIRRGA